MLRYEDLYLLLPQIILALSAIVVMLSIAVKRSHAFAGRFSLVALIGAFCSLIYVQSGGVQITPLVMVDGLGIFFTGMIIVAVFFIALISYPYFKGRKVQKEEYYVLLLLAALGATSMVISNSFVSFFLSLEVMSIAMYGMIAYLKNKPSGIEAGIKYLILAAASVGILLFGVALVYAQTGALHLTELSEALTGVNTLGTYFIVGVALIVAGLGFKLALVPFHLWTPDIYAGAPAPVSAFVASVSKGAVFVFLLRLYESISGSQHHAIWLAFAVLAIASMLIGNWLALRQHNVKRLLAYSSIGHLGYMIVALLASSALGVQAAVFYLVTYFISMLSAFGIVSYLSGEEKDAYELSRYRGLFWEKPWISVLFTGVLLSLAGIPLTAGFIGKFYLLLSGIGSGLWVLAIVLIVSSSIGLFYYLRVVVAMFSRQEEGQELSIRVPSIPTGIALVVLFVLLIWLGVMPDGLMTYIDGLVSLVR